MAHFETVIFILAILLGLSAMADKIRLPYPILLVASGLLIGFVPFLPNLALDPDVALVIFLPPLLYDAASKTSWQEFTHSIRPITTLAVTLVFFTTTAVAIAAYYVIPGFSWPLAFVLGAIVSPPDAVAANSIIKGLGLNKRVIAILEGESLLNDASALIAYRYAVAAVMTGSFVLWQASLQFLFVAGGGMLIGGVLGWLLALVLRRISSATIQTSLTLLAPYLAFLAAEHVHTSGILAVVCTGLLITRRAPEVFSPQARLESRAVWDTTIFLLEGIVFILIGLQLPAIVEGLRGYTVEQLALYSVAVSVVTIVIRILWVFFSTYYPRLLGRSASTNGTASDPNKQPNEIDWRNVLIVAWTGTRGVISLATALALPLTLANGQLFPQRPLILFLAFVVILVTLVLQGLTLPLLVRLLGVKPQNEQAREAQSLELLLASRALKYLEHDFPMPLSGGHKQALIRRYQLLVNELGATLNEAEPASNPAGDHSSVNEMRTAERTLSEYQQALLVELARENRFSDDVLRAAERRLDLEMARLDAWDQSAGE
ncbi:sodium/proton antiporter (CPA1 family) [Larkinella arboricola]|uniref:Sodium/proton antiporter (CPA1 family) n=1 Tax=Larkinella arboricola TaxID=643671 RepID=A0A327X1I1_LARAB|nr:Na+/H+ antiporter [Larkinella arboricola]RAK00218.1 sodium/proton antiporter (CPA1 family) [Larkinella arboricola]